MQQTRSRLFPWYIGIAIIVIFELAIFLQFFSSSSSCTPTESSLFVGLLIVLPVVYLALMYLALRSQP